MIRPGSFETRNNKQHASLSIKAGVLFILHCGNTVILMRLQSRDTRANRKTHLRECQILSPTDGQAFPHQENRKRNVPPQLSVLPLSLS